jgi:hypothetical protein
MERKKDRKKASKQLYHECLNRHQSTLLVYMPAIPRMLKSSPEYAVSLHAKTGIQLRGMFGTFAKMKFRIQDFIISH